MYKRIAIASAVFMVLGILIGFIGFPMFMKSVIKGKVTLKPGSDTRKMWEKFPIPINFAVYVFNLTNPEETMNGGKPKLHEVGPFMFEEWKDKYNLEDIDEEDAVTFNMRNTFNFRPDLGLSGEEVITMPHPLIQIMSISIKRDKAAMINLVSEGIQVIFKPTTPFVSAPFMDLFFRGIDVDCSNDHFAANAICLNFHTESVKGAVKVNATHFKFSLLGAVSGNHSDAGHFKVSRGIKNSRSVGQVLQFDEADELNVWNGDECNRFRGTDSTIFAPLMKPSEGLWAFSGDLCRSLGPRFEKKITYAGIPALRYVMDFGDAKNEPENQCFCKDYPDGCPAKGTMDLNLCNETPLIASLPHFYKCEEKLVDAVEGLNPQEEKHGIFIDFEIITGTPLALAKRLQFSLDVEPIPEVPVMKDLRALVMPLFWVEESITLGKPFTDMLKTIFLTFKINNGFKWIATIFGCVGVLAGLYMMHANRTLRITTVEAANAAAADNKF